MIAKILIVDDQECIRELLSEQLVSEGYCVATAGDPESASGHLRSSQPDLVLLDLYLDGLEGLGVFHDIKRQHPNLPVIIFTAYDSYREDPRLSQADGYVIKSAVLDELKGRIAHLLSRHQVPETTVESQPPRPGHCVAHGF